MYYACYKNIGHLVYSVHKQMKMSLLRHDK